MIKEFIDTYVDALSHHLKLIDETKIKDILSLLKQTREGGGRIFVGGNGGSAAISEHLTCDFTKGTHKEHENPLITHSLSSNFPLISALANDIEYSAIFSKQLELMNLKDEDVVILISSSGNSKNIIQAAEYARSKYAKVIGLTGFDGGLLKTISTINLHINMKNYGIVEDAHQALMHILSQVHAKEFNKWF